MKSKVPAAGPSAVLSFLKLIAEHGGRCSLTHVGRSIHFGLKQLLPLVDTAQLLGLARVEHDEVELSELGRRFVGATAEERRQMEAELLRGLDVVQAILRSLEASSGMVEIDTVAQALGEAGADLLPLVAWGRSAGLWRYDSHHHTFLKAKTR